MTRTAARRIAPAAAIALLLGGCSSGTTTDTPSTNTPAGSVKASASAALCTAFASLKGDAADLVSTRIDTSGTAEAVQQQVDALAAKADKVRDDLNTMMMESDGGPEAAIIGELNQKADALREDLTVAKGNAQADLGPKITAAQDEVKSALEPLTTALNKVCPAG